VNNLLFLRRERMELLFYWVVAFALLGPTLGIQLTAGFNLTFFRVAFILLVACVLINFTMRKKLEASYMYPIRWYAAFFAFWFVYGAISVTWAVSVGAATRYLIFLATMLALTLLIPYFITTEEKFWKTSRVLFGIYAAIVYFAVFESVTWIHLPSSRAFDAKYPTGTVTSVFTNQNDLATCITLALPFLITALFMLNLEKKYKWWIYWTVVFSGYILIATGSRINTVVVVPTIMVLLTVMVPMVIERKKITKKNIITGIAALLVGVLIAVGLSSILLGERKAGNDPRAKILSSMGIISDFKKGVEAAHSEEKEVVQGETGQSVTVRLNLLINGMHFLAKSHFMGVGAGNIEPLMENAPRVNKVNMHNWWAEILVNFGVIIFVLYMSLYVWMCWRLLKLARLKTSPQVSPLIRWGATASLITLIGYLGGGVAPSTAIHYTPMWIAYGSSLAVIIVGEMQKKKASSSQTINENEVAVYE
jgi:teichuronic acid biosynthesis protein TuaE